MAMYGLMTDSCLDQPLFNMPSPSDLPDVFLPMAVLDDLILKDQLSMLRWPHPTKVVTSESVHDQKSEARLSSVNKVAADMEFHVIDDSKDAYFRIKSFLSEEVPAELTKDNKDLQRIEAVVFVDFVALEIEVMIQSWQDRTTITVRDRSFSDVVRMHRLYGQLKEIFARHTEQVPHDVSLQELQCQLLPLDSLPHQDSLDEFNDDWVDSQTMRDRAQALLNDVTSRSVDMRVEGAQILASWTQDCPECRVDIAETLLKNDSHIVEALFQNSSLSLAEVYPIAAMLRHTFSCPDAANVMKNSGIAEELIAMQRLSNWSTVALVAKEFSMAVRCLDKVSPYH